MALNIFQFRMPLLRYEALGAGVLIGLGGFVGDVTISALKTTDVFLS